MFNRELYKTKLNSDSDNSDTDSILSESEGFTKTKSNRKVNIRPANLIIENTNNKIINTEMASISDIKEYIETIPIFKGEPEILPIFVEECERVIKYFYKPNVESATNDFITARIRSKIQGDAFLFIANKKITTFAELKASLISCYSEQKDDATLIRQLCLLEQHNDSAFEFYKKIQKILNSLLSYANLNYTEHADGLCQHFRRVALKTLLEGLKDPLGSLMRTKDPKDFDQALNLLNNTFQKETNAQKFAKNIPPNQNYKYSKPPQQQNFQKQHFQQPQFNRQNFPNTTETHLN